MQLLKNDRQEECRVCKGCSRTQATQGTTLLQELPCGERKLCGTTWAAEIERRKVRSLRPPNHFLSRRI